MTSPHAQDAAAAARHAIADWALARLADRRDVLPRRQPRSRAAAPAGPDGIGTEAALAAAPRRRRPDGDPARPPALLRVRPGTPTVAAAIADMALSAAMIYGGSRLEAGRAVEAEDAVLRWLADAAGFPAPPAAPSSAAAPSPT